MNREFESIRHNIIRIYKINEQCASLTRNIILIQTIYVDLNHVTIILPWLLLQAVLQSLRLLSSLTCKAYEFQVFYPTWQRTVASSCTWFHIADGEYHDKQYYFQKTHGRGCQEAITHSGHLLSWWLQRRRRRWIPKETCQRGEKITHHQLCQGEDPPRDDCTELQMHRVQQADGVENGYACTKTYCYACIYA